MIQWYEGEIVSYNPPGFGANPVLRASVQELSQGVQIENVQMPLINGQQVRPPSQADTGGRGTRIAFYRDSAATAKFGFIISDPTPLHTPIQYDTAALESSQNSPVFSPGEVAFAAQGVNTDTTINDGGLLWLRNSGDACLISGTFNQRVYCSDSSNSIDIEGTQIDIYTHGNAIATHFFAIQDNLGITSLSLGMRNPLTGIGYTTLNCNSDGSFDIGDSLGLSGFTYNLVADLPFVTEVPQISLTSVPLLSELIINPLGLTVFGPKIALSGIMTIDGATTITGDTSITGDVSIIGDTDIEGLVSVKGDVAITGDIGLVGILSINEVPGFTGSVTIAGVTLVYDSGILIAVT
jgi:hypothetical protein